MYIPNSDGITDVCNSRYIREWNILTSLIILIRTSEYRP